MDDSRPDFAKVVLLAGGVGGARMAEGLARALPAGALTVIGNVGDDERFHGLQVCPDIDTLIYTLADRIDRRQGWGLAGDSTRTQDMLAALGAPVWMKLGDADLGVHIWRSQRLAQGLRPTDNAIELGQRLGARAVVLPVSDAELPTEVLLECGWVRFQEWFVKDRCQSAVRELRYCGAATAAPSPEVISALGAADAIVVAPSNPLLSIEPMLAIPGIRAALAGRRVPCLAVSPLIAGKALKGPLGKLLTDLGREASAAALGLGYEGLIDAFVIDDADAAQAARLEAGGIEALITDIRIPDPIRAERLARTVLGWFARRAAGLAAASDATTARAATSDATTARAPASGATTARAAA